GPTMKLVDVHLKTEWQVGTASPSFGSRELSYLPYPGDMVGPPPGDGRSNGTPARRRYDILSLAAANPSMN
ncbi:MAG: hypothetical protein AAGK57_11750, partial [Pseudomonadota bacterium]